MRRALLLMRNSLRNLYGFPIFSVPFFHFFFFFFLVITLRTIGIVDSLIGLGDLFFFFGDGMSPSPVVPIVSVLTRTFFYNHLGYSTLNSDHKVQKSQIQQMHSTPPRSRARDVRNIRSKFQIRISDHTVSKPLHSILGRSAYRRWQKDKKLGKKKKVKWGGHVFHNVGWSSWDPSMLHSASNGIHLPSPATNHNSGPWIIIRPVDGLIGLPGTNGSQGERCMGCMHWICQWLLGDQSHWCMVDRCLALHLSSNILRTNISTCFPSSSAALMDSTASTTLPVVEDGGSPETSGRKHRFPKEIPSVAVWARWIHLVGLNVTIPSALVRDARSSVSGGTGEPRHCIRPEPSLYIR